MDEKQLIADSKTTLQEGHFFRAFDLTKKALEDFPGSIPLRQVAASFRY